MKDCYKQSRGVSFLPTESPKKWWYQGKSGGIKENFGWIRNYWCLERCGWRLGRVTNT